MKEQYGAHSANGKRIADLVQQLADTEAALQALVAGQADAVVDPETGRPLLLREAQAELQRAHDELEQRVQQRTADLERANEALRQYTDRLHVLYEMEQAILAARSPAEIAETALLHLEQLLPCPRAAVCALDPANNAVSLLALRGNGRTVVPDVWQEPLSLDGQLRSFRPGEVRVVADAHVCSPPCPLQGAVDSQEVLACIQAPLFAQEELIGLLNLGLDSPEPLSEDQLTLVRKVADQLAIGIRQSELYVRVQRHATSLEERVAQRATQLRASEAQLRAIFDGAGIGIAVIGEKGQLRDSNPALQRMLGYSGEALRDVTFSDFLHPDDYRPALAAYRELLAADVHSGQRTTEIRYLGKDGEWRWANATLSLVHEDDGRSHLAVVLMEDVTERKQAQEALLHSEKLALTGRLAGSLAHEINNPLQSVVGCLGLAYEMLDEDRDVRRYMEIATEELERVSRIVGRLHDLQRHANVAERERTDVNALLEDVFMLTDSRKVVQQIELQATLADDLPVVFVAPDRIRQVFLNITLNAIDAMPSGGILRVRTARTQDPAGVTISISDTGPGIAPDTLSTLFEPTYSVKADGIGLGLYVARGIIESHRGKIRAENQPGKGTTFEVWLPA